ncbi:MAG: prephenate dehydrogenase/arogenate dehydrogenase family protein, partial [Clostridium butyricum]|nr:prephenate dehydrogenase/arogenate dehydrogenase family protein [Clostridium butyricum]
MKIVVVGLGVIGGSFTMALKKAGYDDVYGIDINEESLEKAKRQGFIKEGFTSGGEIIKDADIIIISLYPRLVKKFILENKDNFKDGAVITDATGIKKLFVEDVINILPSNIDFVFGHPMAGREKKGIDFASAEVFN